MINQLPSPTPDIIICGDFNLPHARWNSSTCATGASKEEQTMFHDLCSFANEHFMTQIIDQPTHRSGNILDLVFTNNANFIHSYSSNVSSLSDHFIVECNVPYTNNDCNSDSSDTEEKDISFNSLNFFHEDIDWSAINNAISNTNWQLLFHSSTPDDMMETFLAVCLETVQKYVPLRRHSDRSNSTRKNKIPRQRQKLMRDPASETNET